MKDTGDETVHPNDKDRSDYYEFIEEEFEGENYLFEIGNVFNHLFWDRMLQVLDTDKGELALDIGTGAGGLTAKLEKRGLRVVGLDISERMIQRGIKKSEKKDIDLVVGDGLEMPFDNETFDLCILSFVLHELPRWAINRIISETRRVCSDEGKIVILDYTRPENSIGRVLSSAYQLYEGRYYEDFLEVDWHDLDIQIDKDSKFFFGTIRVCIGKKGKI